MSLPPSADCTSAVLRQFEPGCHHRTPERRSARSRQCLGSL